MANRLILSTVILVYVSFTSTISLFPQDKPPPPPVSIPAEKPTKLEISNIGVSKKVFTPSLGDTVNISFKVNRICRVVLRIFDPGKRLIKEFSVENSDVSNGISWDGKDQAGNLVPDEAYSFTIEASDYQGQFAVYDPVSVSESESFVPDSLTYDRNRNLITYKLPVDARVRIRAGISLGGPLLINIMNWIPKPAGSQELVWDGKDESKLISVVDQDNYTLSAEAVSLGENSIIAVGNDTYDYVHYVSDIAGERPFKPFSHLKEQTQSVSEGISTTRPIQPGMEPRFSIELPSELNRTANYTPIAQGKLPIKIRLDEQVRKNITEQRYELLFFTDFKFTGELEEGHSPINWIWDSTGLPKGEHVITINIATLGGHMSTRSLKVFVSN